MIISESDILRSIRPSAPGCDSTGTLWENLAVEVELLRSPGVPQSQGLWGVEHQTELFNASLRSKWVSRAGEGAAPVAADTSIFFPSKHPKGKIGTRDFSPRSSSPWDGKQQLVSTWLLSERVKPCTCSEYKST